ncbi:MAG: hypothetical protein ABJB47_04745 [Actinomycetota bacterium]
MLGRDHGQLPVFIKNAIVGLHSAISRFARMDASVECGLVNEVVADADLAGAAWELATELAQGPMKAFGEIKNLLLSTWEQPIEA